MDKIDKIVIPVSDDKISDSELKEIESLNDNDGPWNYKIILLLKKIGNKTMGYRWMHEQEAIKNSILATKYNVIEMLTLVILGVLNGGEFISFIFYYGLQCNHTLYIIIGIVQIITLIISTFIKGYIQINNFAQNTLNHQYVASKIAEINLSIQYQLSLNVNDRDNDIIFLRNTIKNFNDIMYLAPPISKQIKNIYIEGSKENEMFNLFSEENVETNKTTNNTLKYQIDRWLRNF